MHVITTLIALLCHQYHLPKRSVPDGSTSWHVHPGNHGTRDRGTAEKVGRPGDDLRDHGHLRTDWTRTWWEHWHAFMLVLWLMVVAYMYTCSVVDGCGLYVHMFCGWWLWLICTHVLWLMVVAYMYTCSVVDGCGLYVHMFCGWWLWLICTHVLWLMVVAYMYTCSVVDGCGFYVHMFCGWWLWLYYVHMFCGWWLWLICTHADTALFILVSHVLNELFVIGNT